VLQPVGGDHGTGERQRRQQQFELWHLVALVGDLPLSQHHPGAGDRAQQVRRGAVAAAGATDHLAIHGHLRQPGPVTATAPRPLPLGLTLAGRFGRVTADAGTRRRRSAYPTRQPTGDRLLKRITVELAADSPQGGLVRGDIPSRVGMSPRPQQLERALARVSQPLPDRVERARPGQHTRRRHRQQPRQFVAHTSPISRVRHPGQRLVQATLFGATQLHRRCRRAKLANHLADQR
jgi:hypothetical protein